VNNSFQFFIGKKQQLIGNSTISEANRRYGELKFGTNHPGLEALLTLVQGNQFFKARVLSWIFGEGLMKASMAREKLLQLVQAKVKELGSMPPITIKKPPVNVNPSKKVGNMHTEMARDPRNIWGTDLGEESITSHDLFSPEAWRNKPILNNVKIEGMSIEEYYREKLEPEFMVIDNKNKNKIDHTTIDLKKLREIAEAKGFAVFEYGGFNGLIQFIEKGDWTSKPERERHNIDINQQYGPDIRPEMTYNDKTETWEPVKDTMGFDRDGKPIYNFEGGSFSEDDHRMRTVISRMQSNFSKVAKSINDPEFRDRILSQFDPSTLDRWKKILDAKEFVDEISSGIEVKADYKGNKRLAKRAGVARQFGFPDYSKLGDWSPLPDNVDEDTLKGLIEKGLDSPFGLVKGSRFNQNAFGNPHAFGDSLDANIVQNLGKKEKINYELIPKTSDGWFFTTKEGGLIFKLNMSQKEEIKNLIFSDLDNAESENYGKIRTKLRLSNVPSLEEAKPSPNTKINLGSILTNALESSPDFAKTFKILKYQLKGIDPSEYTHQLGNLENSKDLQVVEGEKDISLGDPQLNNLINNEGFEWELTDNEIDNGWRHPFVDFFQGVPGAKNYGILSNGKDRLMVIKKDGKWKLILPSEPQRGKMEPARLDKRAAGDVLAGSKDVLVGGGEKGGHIEANPAGKEDWQKLERELLAGYRGNLHEYDANAKNAGGSYSNLWEIPSVKKGIQDAKFTFNGQKKSEAWVEPLVRMENKGRKSELQKADAYFDDVTLNQWAVEALRLTSGDRAFQIGWTTQEEINAFTGQAGRKGLGKTKKRNLSQEREKEIEANNWMYEPTEGEGEEGEVKKRWGLQALLSQDHRKVFSDRGSEKERDDQYNQITKEIKNIKQDQKELLIYKIADILHSNDNEFLQINAEKIIDGIAENGFLYRVRMIGKYVLSKMNSEYDKAKRLNQRDITRTDGETGDQYDVGKLSPDELKDLKAQQAAADIERRKKGRPGEIERKRLSPSELRGRLGGEFTAANDSRPSSPTAPASQPTAPASQPTAPASQPTAPARRSYRDYGATQTPATATQSTIPPVPATPARRSYRDYGTKQEHFYSYSKWLKSEEMAGTYAIPTEKPHDGCGYNIWGALGKPAVSIAGEANTAKSDPTGKKGVKFARRKNTRKSK
jgi:hypothetical protein